MKANVHPLDIVFRLAEDHGIVLLNGSGFEAPDWSVRVSFANLNDHVYDDIGRAVRAVARGYRQAYEAATGNRPVPRWSMQRCRSREDGGRRCRSRTKWQRSRPRAPLHASLRLKASPAGDVASGRPAKRAK